MDCNGKVLYAFGDSIIEGHTYPQRSCANVVAEAEGMRLFKFARNGAAILPRPMTRPDLGGQIIDQCDEVPAGTPAPDVILFDGGTNDGHLDRIMDRLGEVIDGFDVPSFDRGTFAGCFEATIAECRRRWPSAKIVYVATARLANVDMTIQSALYAIELEACRKWGVGVANVFDDADLDPHRDADRVAYSFDRNGSDGLPGTPQTVTYEHPESQPSGTHPNLVAVERFYAPIIRRALRLL
ncbi:MULTISPECIES: SGNH/GDSL hydrolase family protein [Bifidobacterium]|uniref:SGNH/GDSL hydrolase family protein n=1 Tax=Bifidobacterium TaxID=1678 RepID=UPI001BDC75AF|nr:MULTISPECIES: SGNH/GDSL hydrolase family protein [Bifidobacterium]MBT1161894.1 SGNH/GDSL hydrolase family protein [Bifidobacterium sp. SO1]MBW3079400.1 SGNH/GDSL hydrolase family protein [Bifidobacterium simiiventris]